MREHKEDRRGETVAKILDAARDVFSESGFAGARVDEIARRAGVNKASLYYHIGDKKALYGEVIRRAIGSAAERLAAGIEAARTPEDKMRTYIDTLAAVFDENPRMPGIMMREMASGGRNLPDVFFRDLFSVLGSLSGIIEEGRAKGVFSEVMPLMVHFMTLGATVIYKAVVPVLAAAREAPVELRHLDSNISGQVAREIERLILKAVRE